MHLPFNNRKTLSPRVGFSKQACLETCRQSAQNRLEKTVCQKTTLCMKYTYTLAVQQPEDTFTQSWMYKTSMSRNMWTLCTESFGEDCLLEEHSLHEIHVYTKQPKDNFSQSWKKKTSISRNVQTLFSTLCIQSAHCRLWKSIRQKSICCMKYTYTFVVQKPTERYFRLQFDI